MSDRTEMPTEIDEATAREVRREARAGWPIRRFELGGEPSEDLRDQTTPSERLAMVWPLTVQAWRLAGREIPRYERSAMPGSLRRSSEID